MQTTDVISSAVSLYIKSISSVKTQEDLDILNHQFGKVLKDFFINEGIVLNVATGEFVKANSNSSNSEAPKRTRKPIVPKDVPLENQCVYIIKPAGKPERKCELPKIEDSEYCKTHSKHKNKTTVGAKSQHALKTVSPNDVKKFAGTNNLVKGSDLNMLAEGFSANKFSGAVPIIHTSKFDVKLNPIEGSDVKIEPDTSFLYREKDGKHICIGKRVDGVQKELSDDDLNELSNKEIKYSFEDANLPTTKTANKENIKSLFNNKFTPPKFESSSSSSKFSEPSPKFNSEPSPNKFNHPRFANEKDLDAELERMDQQPSFMSTPKETKSKFSFTEPTFTKTTPSKFSSPFGEPGGFKFGN